MVTISFNHILRNLNIRYRKREVRVTTLWQDMKTKFRYWYN